jgi:hypothetical protein
MAIAFISTARVTVMPALPAPPRVAGAILFTPLHGTIPWYPLPSPFGTWYLSVAGCHPKAVLGIHMHPPQNTKHCVTLSHHILYLHI